MIKKLLALFVTASLVFSMLTAYSADSEILSLQEEKLEFLSTFGIFAQADINDTTPWTRGQFVQSCAGLMGVDAKSDPIGTMIRSGVIKGDGSNLNLDANIKFIDALVMIVRTLGYEDVAVSKGGYPTGYLNVAMSNDICVKADINSEVVTADVVNLLYDATAVPLMDIESISDNGMGYVINEDVTVLSKYFNIRKIEGRVMSVGDAVIGMSAIAGKDKVVIDGVKYSAKDIDMTEFIGLNVMAYADMNPVIPEIIMVEADDSLNGVVILSSDEIVEVKGFDDADTASQKSSPYVEYEIGDKQKKLNINVDCDVLYNGNLTYSVSNSALMPRVGEVRFIDSDTDGKIDLCNIVSYEVFVVDYNSAESGVMAFINSTFTLDVNREYNRITKNGVEISIDGIQSGDTLHIGTELLPAGSSLSDAQNINLVCVSDNFEGKITGLSAETVTVDDAEYEISKAFKNISRLVMNQKYTFYKDIDGKIAEIDEITTDGINYGYLNGAKKEDMKEEVLVQIFTRNNKFEEFKLSKKVKFVSADTDTMFTATQLYKELAPGGNITKQIIRYTLNNSGEVNEIRTAMDKTTDPNYRGVDFDNFTLDEAGRVRIYTNSVGRNFSLGSNTVVIMIPNSGEEDEFSAGGSGLVGGGDIYYDNAKIYDVDENGQIGLLTVPIANKKSEGPPSAVLESNLMLVDSVTRAVVDGEEVYKIYGLQGKKEVVYTSSDSELKDNGATNWATVNTKCYASELTRGDVIQIGNNAKGKADVLHILCSFDGVLPENPSYVMYTPNDGYSTLLNTAYGQVADNVEGAFLRVTSDPTRLYAIKQANIYVYDMAKDKIRIGTASEITTDDWVFIRNRRAVCHEVVVFRR